MWLCEIVIPKIFPFISSKFNFLLFLKEEKWYKNITIFFCGGETLKKVFLRIDLITWKITMWKLNHICQWSGPLGQLVSTICAKHRETFPKYHFPLILRRISQRSVKCPAWKKPLKTFKEVQKNTAQNVAHRKVLTKIGLELLVNIFLR